MLWDIFCRVIDNFGDIGVCWRLGADLAARGQSVRLWADDSSALRWMAPGALENQWPGIQVLPWEYSGDPATLAALPPAQTWIEAFGCDIPEAFVAHRVQSLAQQDAAVDPAAPQQQQRPVWINLEYLSAEPYVERCHGLQSPVLHGPAAGWSKTFFYPGFSAKTGGLLREPGLAKRVQAEPDTSTRADFFSALGVPWQGEQLLSLFCYDPPLLPDLLEQLEASPHASRLLVTPGRAATAVQALYGAQTQVGSLAIDFLPYLSQPDFDRLLCHCDLNCVRGEDSVVRALWAGKPFVWHIYPQQDMAHAAKLEAFMEHMQFSAAVRTLHRAWNGLLAAPAQASALQPLQPHALAHWQSDLHLARRHLLEMDDLGTQLVQFALENR
jgi:uncharacterized repeat protein (TIGR03837 family)